MAQRVGPVSWVQSERFQSWLRAMNARRYNIFVSVNAIASGRRTRTRDAIGAVRHVFLDADDDGLALLSRVQARRDLPIPSYVLHSSPNHIHLFWRVTGFDIDLVERLQKQLARELRTDPAATPVTQNTRLPGFFNHKRALPHLVTVEYRNVDVTYGPEDFPPVTEAVAWSQSVRPHEPSTFDRLPSSGQSGISRPCRRPLLANTATSIPFASAADSSEDSRWTTTRRYTCCRSGTVGASRHGQPRSCSTSFIVPPGMVARTVGGLLCGLMTRYDLRRALIGACDMLLEISMVLKPDARPVLPVHPRAPVSAAHTISRRQMGAAAASAPPSRGSDRTAFSRKA